MTLSPAPVRLRRRIYTDPVSAEHVGELARDIEDMVNSLAPGIPGPPGPAGATGATGATGAAGPPGGLWWPDLPPSSPSAYDDEFPVGALSGKWAPWDPASYLHASAVDGRGLQVTTDPINAQALGGWYQAVPASEFVVYGKFSLLVDTFNVDRVYWGLFIAKDIATNPATDPLEIASLYNDAGPSHLFVRRTFTNYNTGTSNNSFDSSGFSHLYIRMRVNGTTFWTDYSSDGIGWINWSSALTAAFTPLYFGFTFMCATHIPPLVRATGYLKFIRVFSGAGTSGYDSTSIGRLS